jgi:hypothetical protein
MSFENPSQERSPWVEQPKQPTPTWESQVTAPDEIVDDMDDMKMLHRGAINPEQDDIEERRITPSELKRIREEVGDLALLGVGEAMPMEVPPEPGGYDFLFNGSSPSVDTAPVLPPSRDAEQYETVQYNVNGHMTTERFPKR